MSSNMAVGGHWPVIAAMESINCCSCIQVKDLPVVFGLQMQTK